MPPNLDRWIENAPLQVRHSRRSSAPADKLWESARSLRLADTRMLGRLIRWRIPGTEIDVSFDELFRCPPFVVLCEDEYAIVSGLVGRIWTLRRDYPELSGPDEFRVWGQRGTAKVIFANWVEPLDGGGAMLASETRVEALGGQGRVGLAAVRPLVSAFHQLVGSDGIEAAVRRAEGGRPDG